MRPVVSWLLATPEALPVALMLLIAFVRVSYAILSTVLRPFPRLRAAVEAVAALGPDILRASAQTYRAVTGREFPVPVVDARDERITALEKDVRARDERIAALERSCADTPPARPSARPPGMPPTMTAALLLIVLAASGCATLARARGAHGSERDAAGRNVVFVATMTRKAACDDVVSALLGRPPLAPENARELATSDDVVAAIRGYVCSDLLAHLLDLAGEFFAGPPPAVQGDAGPPPAVQGDGGTAAPTPADVELADGSAVP